MQIRIKSIMPFKTWEKCIPCNVQPQAICGTMREFAENFPVCHITLEKDNAIIAYARWSIRRGVHDLGCNVALERL